MYLGCPWYPGILCIEELGGLYGGMYLECPWYPGIPCIEGLGGGLYGGKYLGCPWYPGILCLRDWGSIWGDVPGMSLVSRDTMTVLRSMEGCTWDVLGILGYNV